MNNIKKSKNSSTYDVCVESLPLLDTEHLIGNSEPDALAQLAEHVAGRLPDSSVIVDDAEHKGVGVG